MNICLSQTFQCGNIISNVFFAVWCSYFDSIVDIYAFNAHYLKAFCFYLLLHLKNTLHRPFFSCRNVI